VRSIHSWSLVYFRFAGYAIVTPGRPEGLRYITPGRPKGLRYATLERLRYFALL
jgi:hypothetical protein